MFSTETLVQGMDTCATDINSETLVTDLVHELSSGLEIPFLLEDNNRTGLIIGKPENNCAFDNAFYEEPVKEYLEDDSYFNFANNYDSIFHIKEENNDLESSPENNITRTSSGSCFSRSGSGSGSECSLTEFWSTKIELDTPPVTPPDERISPDSVFLLPSEEFKFIPICTEEKVERKNNNDYKQSNRRVRIQPKPTSAPLNVFEAQPLNVQTIHFNVFGDVNSNNLTKQDSLERNIFLEPEKKRLLLTKKDLELQAKRKQDRMIRNRESAYLSRKRKKEHVANLEKQVQDLQTENKQLRLENCSLRQRLAEYEDLIPIGKKPMNLFTDSPRKTTALLALLFTVCLNIGSFSSLINEKRISKNDIDVVSENVVPNYQNDLRRTRSLLWADNNLESLNSSYANLTKTSCPLSVNQTESIRLESELRRWIGGDEDYLKQPKGNVSKISQYFYLGERPPHRQNIPKRKQRVKKSNFQKRNLEMNMYQMNLVNFNTFFQAIRRRDDTFYLVSFSSDHLLLPALSHNQTSRPKMSLMLPAFVSNGTGADQVEMMQIDCEVTNTQLLSVNENDIPSHMRPYTNSTSRTKSRTKAKVKEFEDYFVNDLPVSFVPAENVTHNTEKTDLSYDNSSRNYSKFFPQYIKNNISKSSDFDVMNVQVPQLNLTFLNGNDLADNNSPYLQYKKSLNIFFNQSYKQDPSAVEFISDSGKNFLKFFRGGLPAESNLRTMKFNSEKSSYKSYSRNAAKFLFN